jgi:hypothetical protein
LLVVIDALALRLGKLRLQRLLLRFALLAAGQIAADALHQAADERGSSKNS